MSNVSARLLTDADIPHLLALNQSEDIQREFFRRSRQDGWSDLHILQELARETRYASGIIRSYVITEDDAVAGYVCANADVTMPGSRILGYWIGANFRGRNIMPRGVDAVMNDVRANKLGVLFRAAIRPENTSSRRVVEKLGFREIRSGSEAFRHFIHH